MTPRAAQILKAIMRVLRDADGEPMDPACIGVELLIFVSSPEASLLEIQTAIKQAELRGWIQGHANDTEQMRWAITTKGRLADLK